MNVNHFRTASTPSAAGGSPLLGGAATQLSLLAAGGSGGGGRGLTGSLPVLPTASAPASLARGQLALLGLPPAPAQQIQLGAGVLQQLQAQSPHPAALLQAQVLQVQQQHQLQPRVASTAAGLVATPAANAIPEEAPSSDRGTAVAGSGAGGIAGVEENNSNGNTEAAFAAGTAAAGATLGAALGTHRLPAIVAPSHPAPAGGPNRAAALATALGACSCGGLPLSLLVVQVAAPPAAAESSGSEEGKIEAQDLQDAGTPEEDAATTATAGRSSSPSPPKPHGGYVDRSLLPDPPFLSPGQRRARGGVSEPFPEKLHRILRDAEAGRKRDVVGFFPHGRAFCVFEPERFTKEVMPEYFPHGKMSSFQRQLNLYGFTRIKEGPDSNGYYHELFLEGRPALCNGIRRVTIKGAVAKKGDGDKDDRKPAATITGADLRRGRKPGDDDDDDKACPDFYSMPPIKTSKEALALALAKAAASRAREEAQQARRRGDGAAAGGANGNGGEAPLPGGGDRNGNGGLPDIGSIPTANMVGELAKRYYHDVKQWQLDAEARVLADAAIAAASRLQGAASRLQGASATANAGGTAIQGVDPDLIRVVLAAHGVAVPAMSQGQPQQIAQLGQGQQQQQQQVLMQLAQQLGQLPAGGGAASVAGGRAFL